MKCEKCNKEMEKKEFTAEQKREEQYMGTYRTALYTCNCGFYFYEGKKPKGIWWKNDKI